MRYFYVMLLLCSSVYAQDTVKVAEVVVSTGYQELPRERATGSFVKVDKALVERGVSTSVLDRLRDVVPGLLADPRLGTFRVRGQSTLFSNADPLIVVDGFPFNEPLVNLNPNDIESISVLKDAAAASIWGTKAGNGVVVITTKRGYYNKPVQLSFNSSLQVGDRPDLFFMPKMSTADYIGIERRLYAQDYYKATLASPFGLPVSPVVELLAAGGADLEGKLAALGNLDVRNDLKRYWYRPSVSQQYAGSLTGGNADSRYFYSAGFDKNLDNLVGNGLDRVTLKGTQTWALLDRKLELTVGMNYIRTLTRADNPGNLAWNRGQALYPYGQLDGSLIKDYRVGFTDAAQKAGLLNWAYRPLDELALAENRVQVSDYRLNTAAKYRLPLGFSLGLQYLYDRAGSEGRNLQSADSYYTRNLINRYTQIISGTLVRPIPLGGILDLANSTTVHHDLRAQLDFQRTWGQHELVAIAGYEIQSLRVLGNENRLYGYDAAHSSSLPVDGVTLFPYYDNPNAGTAIPLNQSERDLSDHTLSYYANAAYTFLGRYTFSGSARLDRSNLFGVAANQKGVPLWSAGLAWDLTKEDFYRVLWLPQLRLRATYGFNGNVNKSLSAYTTASYLDGANQATLLPFASIVNPPNPQLRWERNRQVNLAVDFGLVDRRLSGSLEFFWKAGLDLIGSTAYAPSSGVTVFTGNTAATRGKGFDLSLESRNLAGKLNWTTNFFLSYVSDIVSAYSRQSSTASYLQFGNSGGYPLEGRPLLSVYSYVSAGLDAVGDPQGYLNGAVSKNYSAIASANKPDDLVYHGPARPPVFGALRNTFNYGRLNLSVNISYQLGFYFRKTGLRYGNDNGLSQQHGDYALRWQKAGDEAVTGVPALPAAPNLARDDFYNYSSPLVQKGDHIRLKDVRLAYRLKWTVLYLYAANLGLIWRANKIGQDPEYPNTFPAPMTIAAGLRINY